MRKQKIGIFDSGVGGLSILKSMHELMPEEEYIYLGDNINAPYGESDDITILKNSNRILDFMLEKKVDVCVIACNTICVVAYDELKKRSNIPIIGIIDKGVESILDTNKSKVGIIATKKTIETNKYKEKLLKENPNMKIVNIEGVGLVETIEKGIVSKEKRRIAVERVLKNHKNIEVAFLGCTHFPFLEKEISEYLENITVIHQGDKVARHVKKVMQIKKDNGEKKDGKIEFFTTGDVYQFENIKNINFNKFKQYKTKKVKI